VPEGFEIPADLVRSLDQRLQTYMESATDAYGEVKDVVYTEVMRRAEASPRWVKVADFIDAWDDEDRFWVGVRSPDFVSEAFASEYGTDEYPPDPILRTLDDVSRMAAARADGLLNSKLGMQT